MKKYQCVKCGSQQGRESALEEHSCENEEIAKEKNDTENCGKTVRSLKATTKV
jgi:hypothetical protein